MTCLFCRIVNGELPSTKVYEDEQFVAFLDILPFQKGHLLVVPKEHAENFLRASADSFTGLFGLVQRLAGGMMKALNAQGFNILINNGRVAGNEIDHLHVHIVPRFPEDDLKHWEKTKYEEGEMQIIGEKIRTSL